MSTPLLREWERVLAAECGPPWDVEARALQEMLGPAFTLFRYEWGGTLRQESWCDFEGEYNVKCGGFFTVCFWCTAWCPGGAAHAQSTLSSGSWFGVKTGDCGSLELIAERIKEAHRRCFWWGLHRAGVLFGGGSSGLVAQREMLELLGWPSVEWIISEVGAVGALAVAGRSKCTK